VARADYRPSTIVETFIGIAQARSLDLEERDLDTERNLAVLALGVELTEAVAGKAPPSITPKPSRTTRGADRTR